MTLGFTEKEGYMANISQLIADLDALTSTDKKAVVSALEDKLGIKVLRDPTLTIGDQTVVAVAKTEFDVTLTGFRDKISCIKEIRAVTGLDLRSAKEFVESCPRVISEGVSAEEAQMIAGRLRSNGGDVEVK